MIPLMRMAGIERVRTHRVTVLGWTLRRRAHSAAEIRFFDLGLAMTDGVTPKSCARNASVRALLGMRIDQIDVAPRT